MNFLNSPAYNGAVSPFVELIDSAALNGHLYTKNNLTPKPLSFFPWPFSYSFELNADKIICIMPYSVRQYNVVEGNWTVDNTNPDRAMHIVQMISAATTDHRYVLSTRQKDGTYTANVTAAEGYTGRPKRVVILGQDALYYYTLVMPQATWVARLYKLTKQQGGEYPTSPATPAPSYIDTGQYPVLAHIMADTPQYIYILDTGIQTVAAAARFYVYSKTANTWAHAATYTAAQLANPWISAIPVPSPPVNSYSYCANMQTNVSSTSNVGLRWYKIDTTKTDAAALTTGAVDWVIPASYPVRWGGSVADTAPAQVYYTHTFKSDSGKTYIVCTMSSLGTIPSLTDGSFPYIVVWELNAADPTKATLVSHTPLNQWYSGVVSSNGGRTMVCAYDGGVDLWTWREGSKTFAIGTSANEPVKMVGVDKLSNVYILRTNNTLTVMSQGAPASEVSLKFAEDIMNVAVGYPKTTQLSISARNAVGARIATKVKVCLYGPCTFDNSTATKIITTSATTDSVEQITVTSPGTLNATGFYTE